MIDSRSAANGASAAHTWAAAASRALRGLTAALKVDWSKTALSPLPGRRECRTHTTL